MTIIKGAQRVWLTDTGRLTARDIQEAAIDAYLHQGIIGQVQFSNADMSRYGWTEIGAADVEITLLHRDDVVEKLAEGLREQIKATRAEAQSKVAQLEEKLNQLLALPNPGGTE